jgi:hypothetical protein
MSGCYVDLLDQRRRIRGAPQAEIVSAKASRRRFPPVEADVTIRFSRPRSIAQKRLASGPMSKSP